VCGAVRYRVTNAPFRTGVCHCRFCQRRTGSAFGVGVYFKKTDFQLIRGELKCYEHKSDESGRWLRMEFCPACGTTVTWTLELFPDGRGVAGGSFDQSGSRCTISASTSVVDSPLNVCVPVSIS